MLNSFARERGGIFLIEMLGLLLMLLEVYNEHRCMSNCPGNGGRGREGNDDQKKEKHGVFGGAYGTNINRQLINQIKLEYFDKDGA